MGWRGDDDVGRISVELSLANNQDVQLAQAGALPAERVRRAQVEAVVDTGATRLVLPEGVVQELGLTTVGQTTVRYADQRTAIRPVVGNVWMSLLGRDSVFSAVVEPDRSTALVGAIVLEELDLVADCSTQTLYPRDPDRIISEIE